jgi:catechol 2,3-dioxygenase-like lactoylglutathione lyase family enzyme
LSSFGDIPMTEWFARPVLRVMDVEASLRFYVNRLGFTSPWRYAEDGKAYVAQVDRQGCAPILANTRPAIRNPQLIRFAWGIQFLACIEGT